MLLAQLPLDYQFDMSSFHTISLCFENCEHADFDAKDFKSFGISEFDGYIHHFGFELNLNAIGHNLCCNDKTPIQRLQQYHDITQITFIGKTLQLHFYVLWPWDNDYSHPGQAFYVDNDILVYTCFCDFDPNPPEE